MRCAQKPLHRQLWKWHLYYCFELFQNFEFYSSETRKCLQRDTKGTTRCLLMCFDATDLPEHADKRRPCSGQDGGLRWSAQRRDSGGHLVSLHEPACDGADQGSGIQPETPAVPDWEVAVPWALRPDSKTDLSQVGGPGQVIAPLCRPLLKWAFQDYPLTLAL